MSIEKLQQEIDDLQSRVAYQEDMLQSLNSTIADQDKVIHLLAEKLKRWETRLDEVAYSVESEAGKASEPPPPHY